jgi:hypothetical protein
MAFPSIVDPSHDYNPYYPSLHPHEYWNDSPTFKGQLGHQISSAGSTANLPIDRFLGEQDGPTPLFRAHLNTVLPPCPNLDLDNPYAAYYGNPEYAYRYPSPTDSGHSSAYNCRGHSDCQSSPWSSPHLSAARRSPESLYLDRSGCGVGFRQSHDQIGGSIMEPCVALHDVQGYADAQPETTQFEDEPGFYALPQEGFEPMEQELEAHTPVHSEVNGVVNGNVSVHRDANSPESPNIRRRRPTGARSPTTSSKVTKRPSSRRSSSFSKINGHKNHSYCASASNRAFPCPFAIYNCTATFGAKNEWKRHVNTQHMQTGYWRCDQCDQSDRKPNDFNRKDLFIQHVRRMHALELEKPSKPKANSSRPAKNDPEEREMNAIASRCFMAIRQPPKDCSCIVCGATFTGEGAWDERLEHIGKHWEAMKKENEEPNEPKDWQEDHVLHEFLGQQGIIAYEGKQWILA